MIAPIIFTLLSHILSVKCISIDDSESAFVEPVIIKGKHFANSVTNSRFQIKGIDYQPGGSAGYDGSKDPLSDVETCARDIFLMQQLGVNTIRVYTVNPALDHSECMTLMAAANMYLVLDINSPLIGESINRYEPWTTYTPEYLKHIFGVVQEFSQYNNTLAFFIGNEIVNDERSSEVSPAYIKAVTRDVKDYMYYQCPRLIPVGYSAADDLNYRKELPHYLSCGAQGTAIDFYGVNSYQWCGKQTLESSGYDVLLKDYKEFNFPVFLSEFGCNIIQPRIFQEIDAIFEEPMSDVFDGGLVYEYSQGPNNYGLVEILENGDVKLKPEFKTVQDQYGKIKPILECPVGALDFLKESGVDDKSSDKERSGSSFRSSTTSHNRRKQAVACKPSYPKLKGATSDLPKSFGTEMIKNGLGYDKQKQVSYIPELIENLSSIPYRILDVNNDEISFTGIKNTKKLFSNINAKSSGLPKGGETDASNVNAKQEQPSKLRHTKQNTIEQAYSQTAAAIFPAQEAPKLQELGKPPYNLRDRVNLFTASSEPYKIYRVKLQHDTPEEASSLVHDYRSSATRVGPVGGTLLLLLLTLVPLPVLQVCIM